MKYLISFLIITLFGCSNRVTRHGRDAYIVKSKSSSWKAMSRLEAEDTAHKYCRKQDKILRIVSDDTNKYSTHTKLIFGCIPVDSIPLIKNISK